MVHIGISNPGYSWGQTGFPTLEMTFFSIEIHKVIEPNKTLINSHSCDSLWDWEVEEEDGAQNWGSQSGAGKKTSSFSQKTDLTAIQMLVTVDLL